MVADDLENQKIETLLREMTQLNMAILKLAREWTTLDPLGAAIRFGLREEHLQSLAGMDHAAMTDVAQCGRMIITVMPRTVSSAIQGPHRAALCRRDEFSD